jgi:hypothetical protein
MGGIHQFSLTVSSTVCSQPPYEVHLPVNTVWSSTGVIPLVTTRTRSLSSRTRRWRTTTVIPQDGGRTAEVTTGLVLGSSLTSASHLGEHAASSVVASSYILATSSLISHHLLDTPGEQPMTQPRATTISRFQEWRGLISL